MPTKQRPYQPGTYKGTYNCPHHAPRRLQVSLHLWLVRGYPGGGTPGHRHPAHQYGVRTVPRVYRGFLPL